MNNRQANDQIKGYFYQFDKTIVEILKSEETSNIHIESIEDIDIENPNEYEAIQCKYYSKQEYNHSVIKPAIIFMFKHYLKNIDKNLKYTIYANFKEGQDKLPQNLELSFFKKNFLEYTKYDIFHKVYEEENASDVQIQSFIDNLAIDIYADEYELQEKKIKKILKEELDCSDELVDLYFIKAGSIIKELAIKESERDRVINKRQFLSMLTDVNIILDKWYLLKIGKEKYAKIIRKKYFSKQNISPYERFFILDCFNETNLHNIKKMIMIISNKWSKLSKRTPDPFCPYIVLANIEANTIVELKGLLNTEDFRLIDGYDYYGAHFSVKSITQQPNYYNKIKIKILLIDELQTTMDAITKQKEIYQFYKVKPLFNNSTNSIVNIKVDKLAEIEDIV